MRYASDLPDFQDLLRATSDDADLPRWIVEKDYYVMRALCALQDKIGEQFLFKGGTSLSKSWNLIERFSEDIDLLFRTEQNGEELNKKNRHTFAGTSKPLRYSRVSIAFAALLSMNVSVLGSTVSLTPTR